MSIIIGIDLGTTNTVAAYVNQKGEPVILTPKIQGQNKTLLPSVVYFNSDEPIVGIQAKNRLSHGSSSLGIAQVKLELMKKSAERLCLSVGAKTYKPEDIQAIILKKAVEDANDTLRSLGAIDQNEFVRDVIITIPAFFKQEAREQTENAAKKAGLVLRGLIHEPAAAALCYFSNNDTNMDQTMLVLDLGGGTFDICLLSKKGQTINVLAQSGGPQQGGHFWDRKLLDYALGKLCEQGEIREDILNDEDELDAYLLTEDGNASIFHAERCREALTQRESADMVVKWKNRVYSVIITRDEFNRCCSPLLQDLFFYINDVCQSTGHFVEEGYHKRFKGIDKILLVGGASQMPIIERSLYDSYDASRSMVVTRNDTQKYFSPYTCVAIGAAIYGHNIGYYKFCWEKTLNSTEKASASYEPDIRLVSDVREPDLVLKVPINYTYGINVWAPIDGQIENCVYNVLMKGEKLTTLKRIDQSFTTCREKQNRINITVFESQSSKDLEKFNPNKHTPCGCISFTMDSMLPEGTKVQFSIGTDLNGKVCIVAECKGIRKQLVLN